MFSDHRRFSVCRCGFEGRETRQKGSLGAKLTLPELWRSCRKGECASRGVVFCCSLRATAGNPNTTSPQPALEAPSLGPPNPSTTNSQQNPEPKSHSPKKKAAAHTTLGCPFLANAHSPETKAPVTKMNIGNEDTCKLHSFMPQKMKAKWMSTRCRRAPSFAKFALLSHLSFSRCVTRTKFRKLECKSGLKVF